MFNGLNIIERITSKICNILNVHCKICTFQYCLLTLYDNPVYGKYIALEKGNSYKKISYYNDMISDY